MKVKFVKDKRYDAFMIWAMLSSNDPAGVGSRAKSMGIASKALEEISKAQDYGSVSEYLDKITQAKYSVHNAKIGRSINRYQKEWDTISGTFSSEVARITGYEWFHQTYYVVVSPFHKGISSRGGDKVIRTAFEDKKDQLRITAHEVLMSQLWNVLFEIYPEVESSDPLLHYWALNEITTTAILGLEDVLNDLWTPPQRGFDNFLANYPQLNSLKTEFKVLYLKKSKKTGFKDYLDNALNLLDAQYAGVSFGF